MAAALRIGLGSPEPKAIQRILAYLKANDRETFEGFSKALFQFAVGRKDDPDTSNAALILHYALVGFEAALAKDIPEPTEPKVSVDAAMQLLEALDRIAREAKGDASEPAKAPEPERPPMMARLFLFGTEVGQATEAVREGSGVRLANVLIGTNALRTAMDRAGPASMASGHLSGMRFDIAIFQGTARIDTLRGYGYRQGDVDLTQHGMTMRSALFEEV